MPAAFGSGYDVAMLRSRFLLLPGLLLWPLAAQVRPVPGDDAPPDGKDANSPDRRQKDALAKAAYMDSLEDTKKLIAMAEDLKTELERNDRYVVSLAAIHKTEEIEKLAKRIRGRLKQ